MTKSAKSAWQALLVELAPVLAAFLIPMLLRRFTAPAAAPAKSRAWLFVLLALAGFAVFTLLTVFLVKFGWKHL